MIRSFHNFRDVADSFSSSTEGRIARGRLFRSATPWLASAVEVDHLSIILGIRLVIDLRTPTEQRQGDEHGESGGALAEACAGSSSSVTSFSSSSHPSCCGVDGKIRCVRRVRAPLLNEDRFARIMFHRAGFTTKLAMLSVAVGIYQPEDCAKKIQAVVNGLGLVGMYKVTLEDSADQIGRCLREMITADSLPVLVHCTSGKDRTGILCALILNLCGFSDDDIVEDYHITERHISKLFASDVIKTVGNFVGEHMKRAPKSVMYEILAFIRKKHGTIPGYLEEKANFSLQEQARLVEMLQSTSACGRL